jgi:hypothetical protein
MKRIGMSLGEYYRSIHTPLVAVILMAPAVYSTRLIVPLRWPVAFLVILKIVVGIVTYGLVIWGLYPAAKLALWRDLLLRMRARTPAHAALGSQN